MHTLAPVTDARASSGSQEVSNPYISVVVLAEEPRPYLRVAVESVLAQDLPRTRFELLVVLGFEDPTIEAYLLSIGARPFFAPRTSVAVKMAIAAQQTRAPILAFLDDDDMFEPTRLRAIADAFQSNSRLGLFRNQQTIIGPDGGPLAPSLIGGPGGRRWNARSPLIIAEGHKQAGLDRITIQRPDFNDSSLAIRRDLVEQAIPYLRRLEGRADTLLFFVAACSELSIQLDPRRLTRYRIHQGNLSLSGGGSALQRMDRLVSYAHQIQADYNVTREFVRAHDCPSALRLIDARIAMARLILAARESGVPRRTFVQLIARLLRYWRTYPVREDLQGVLSSGLFIVSPSLGRAVYEHRLGVR